MWKHQTLIVEHVYNVPKPLPRRLGSICSRSIYGQQISALKARGSLQSENRHESPGARRPQGYARGKSPLGLLGPVSL